MAMFPALMNDTMFSDLFDDPFFSAWRGERNARPSGRDSGMNAMMSGAMMNTDVRDMGDGYDVDIDMPGFKKDDISVELKNGYLTVSATKSCGCGCNPDKGSCAADSGASDSASGSADSSDQSADGKWLRRERYTGSCSRSFYVGEDMKESDIHAKYENGTLCLTLPKKDAAKQVEQKHTIAIEG